MSEKLNEVREKMRAAAEKRVADAKAATAAEVAEGEQVKTEGLIPVAQVKQAPENKTVTKPVGELAEDDIKKIRIFKSRIPGSSFVFQEGYTIFFTDGWYETSDESEIKQLDAVANKVPTIHTDEHEQDIINAIIEARRQGFTGSIGEALTTQLTMEQRIKAIRGNVSHLHLPTERVESPLVPGVSGGITAADAASADKTLRDAIRAASVQSNSR